MGSAVVRPLHDEDDIGAITELIRAAYAQLSAMGLRYWATFQSVEDTQKRFTDGHGLVAVLEGKIVGTLTIYPPEPNSEVQTYRMPTTFSIGQFAVDPSLQSAGIGRLLHAAAIEHIVSRGGTHIALDTADQAHHLIAMYNRWGYTIVERADWRPLTNYESVVMMREVRG